MTDLRARDYTVGQSADPVREAWRLRFGLSRKQYANALLPEMCWQLCQCKDDMARRILLGVTEKF